MQIFDQLAPHVSSFGPGVRFDDESRLLLEAASLLHDVGYLINYAQHHKHSFHLIVHADLPGLTTRQIQVIANVARYHRAADPKLKHAPFAALSPDDRELVTMLAAILRIADGLDRTHMQSVTSVDLSVGGTAVDARVDAEHQPSVDLWGAVRKSGLFREVFKRDLNVEWNGKTETSATRDEDTAATAKHDGTSLNGHATSAPALSRRDKATRRSRKHDARR